MSKIKTTKFSDLCGATWRQISFLDFQKPKMPPLGLMPPGAVRPPLAHSLRHCMQCVVAISGMTIIVNMSCISCI